ncbi:hypothetical protein GPECTOR_6g797 [Gonium pectorale]|uniref:Aromatic amino acid beta-eliminating lyase/threonine aldolase domain-containing protein n=1 Tax=Gonium pectorale TaxID=33097 RepID=A0A150GVL0_GONPE|nr:hypothetical protein GPECTOR_6g797 [Gonium pectorale]|eukprot:KXZ53879.1 hypothetical protein GPECTOR_6g797 [Gonium pectorale]
MTGAPENGGPKPTLIDLRSDTVTKPGLKMLQAMMNAEVGDDVWGDDPTVNELQDFAARMFGMEAGLFCPSGTMTNQIAIKASAVVEGHMRGGAVHTQPGDELLCADNAHIYLYEGGGIAFNSGVQPKLLPSDRGRISAAQIAAAINMEDSHFPVTRLVCLENTANKGGGAYYSLQDIREISSLCRERGLKLHLDGARVFNAFVEAGYGPAEMGPLFDSVSICLSKGLGCPVGSLLLGPRDFIRRAHRIRKVLGGGMRQAGFLAAAGLYALQHNVERLRDDHARARRLGAVLSDLPYVSHLAPVDSNIVIFSVAPGWEAKSLVERLKARGVLISTMAPGVLRLVTHLDVGDAQVDAVCGLLRWLAEEGQGQGGQGGTAGKGPGAADGPTTAENGHGAADGSTLPAKEEDVVDVEPGSGLNGGGGAAAVGDSE